MHFICNLANRPTRPDQAHKYSHFNNGNFLRLLATFDTLLAKNVGNPALKEDHVTKTIDLIEQIIMENDSAFFLIDFSLWIKEPALLTNWI